MKTCLILLVLHVSLLYGRKKYRVPQPAKYPDVSQKYENPNFIRDRFKNVIFKPPMPTNFRERFRKPWTPAWMDYCDPYHCNDYHRTACGINLKKRVAKWFQSGCHIILNNECASFRGTLQYQQVETKYCDALIMSVRHGCGSCEPGGELVCAVSSVDNRVTLFRDRCAVQHANCAPRTYDEYEEVDMGLCVYYLKENINKLNVTAYD